ncbi:ATPbinding cassette sub-family E protein [Entamoeba marina]
MHSKKTAFIVEHDFIMATYLADKVVVYEGQPAANCTANAPIGMVEGMNTFLKDLDITFQLTRPIHKRSRTKKEGRYFYTDVD